MPPSRRANRSEPRVMPVQDRHCQRSLCGHKHAFKLVQGGVKLYSRYCSRHTCRYPTGDGIYCHYPKEPQHRLCGHHRKCGVSGCLHDGEIEGHPELIWFCPGHSCTVPGCYIQKSSGSIFCEGHIPCEVPGCFNRPGPGGRFCQGHGCRIESCDREATCGQRCEDHVPCVVPHCTRFSLRSANGRPEEFCEIHGFCRWPHCDQTIEGRKQFCRFHRCSLRECNLAKKEGSHFCSSHCCRLPGCTAIIDYLFHLEARYCNHHQCAEISCVHESHPDGRYCRYHSCQKEGCLELCPDMSARYCNKHECKAELCISQARMVGGFCNSKHACSIEGCPHRRLVTEELVSELCIDHLIRAREDEAAGESQATFSTERHILTEEIEHLRDQLLRIQVERQEQDAESERRQRHRERDEWEQARRRETEQRDRENERRAREEAENREQDRRQAERNMRRAREQRERDAAREEAVMRANLYRILR
ncbi:hypothetical protein F5Y15DRAFT_380327 [Xylariaceae sp. FL0016]|nr:hypothetical protein F5Y15DRAFT_380327 [Xylariaceae sp. FL0016]